MILRNSICRIIPCIGWWNDDKKTCERRSLLITNSSIQLNPRTRRHSAFHYLNTSVCLCTTQVQSFAPCHLSSVLLQINDTQPNRNSQIETYHIIKTRKWKKHSLSIILTWTTGFMVKCLSLKYSMCLKKCPDLCMRRCQILTPRKMVGLHPLRDAGPSCIKPDPCTLQSMREGLISRPIIQKWNSVGSFSKDNSRVVPQR